VVHHGGVGTTAEALAAGTPQLVLPLAWDQTDNGTRVRRLGAGDWLPSRRATGSRMAAALARLMTPEGQRRSRQAAARFGADGALDTAAGWVEGLAATGPPP
jgi:UDP:flavonoid glycosyltransferase YjiC (YdhE family)